MRKKLLVFGLICVAVLSSCSNDSKNKALLVRSFPTLSWERFDFVENKIDIQKPSTYNLVLDVSFDPSYTYNYFSVVFSVFDSEDNLLRSRNYKFRLKENDGSWKSSLIDGIYHFSFPINSELTINEPGTYLFQIENRMPITPLYGIKEISINYQ
jgi:gliding motility-associated lipoprotein GldH